MKDDSLAVSAQAGHNDDLDTLRKSIDDIDAEIVRQLGRRFEVSRSIGELKAALDRAPVDVDREARVFTRLRILSAENAVNQELVAALYHHIVATVVGEHRQTAIEHSRLAS